MMNQSATFFRRLPVASLCVSWIALASGAVTAAAQDEAESLRLQTRQRLHADGENDACQIVYKTVEWDPQKTAVIICDMWDKHWCAGATARVKEMAPRMNEFVSAARNRGALIVHAPSSCMEAYADHPARKRAQEAPQEDLPDFLKGWNRKLESEEGAEWPVDQSDGGCDCQSKCPGGGPWRSQVDTIEIHDADAISDSGLEIGGLLKSRGIENVILVGVHTNMCVIGRPFGLRNMVRFGQNVVLVRDLTDTMYNSRKAPFVPHVRGTEVVVEYIEQFVCPTITSSSLLGGPALRFKQDDRPHVAMIVSDDHYGADKTLPVFADELRRQYGCSVAVIHGEGTNRFPAMDELKQADVAILFIRRLALPKQQLDLFREYLAAGKPLVALRTASHAFDIKRDSPEGCDQWRDFDPQVLGGSYHGHGPNNLGSDIANVPEMSNHPILAGVTPAKWHSTGSLYNTAPIADDATLLMTGSIPSASEPVTWTRNYNKSRVFYSALGHPDDFQLPQFRRLLVNAIFWAMDKPVPQQDDGDVEQ